MLTNVHPVSSPGRARDRRRRRRRRERPDAVLHSLLVTKLEWYVSESGRFRNSKQVDKLRYRCPPDDSPPTCLISFILPPTFPWTITNCPSHPPCGHGYLRSWSKRPIGHLLLFVVDAPNRDLAGRPVALDLDLIAPVEVERFENLGRKRENRTRARPTELARVTDLGIVRVNFDCHAHLDSINRRTEDKSNQDVRGGTASSTYYNNTLTNVGDETDRRFKTLSRYDSRCMSVRVNTETGELVDSGTLRSTGASTVVTLPPDILAQAGMNAGDNVEFAVDLDREGEITIRTEGEDA